MQLPDKFNIRHATPADAALLAQFAARSFFESFRADTAPADMTAFLAQTYGAERQGAEIRDPSITTWLAEADGQLAGFCQVRKSRMPECVATRCGPQARVLELGRLYVDACWHGSGLAAKLMQAAFGTAREKHASHLWLGVFEHNLRAQRFYLKSGFTPVGRYVFQVGNDPQRDLILLAPVGAA